MVELNEDNFDTYLEDKTVLVDFWAEWCAPCRMLAPTLRAIERDHDIAVAKINIDNNTELARRFQIMSIPTMILFKDGQPVQTVVGVKPKHELEKQFGLIT